MSSVSERLLEAAEHRIRTGGFNSVSFRDLAGDLGIKSASVHYHFPKKEDLGVAVVDRYSAGFFGALEARVARGADAGVDKVSAFVDVYRTALQARDTICLCGVMGAESQGLPEPVRARVGQFLQANVAWLTDAYVERGVANPGSRATQAVASLQGAMMLSVSLDTREVFETVAQSVSAT